MYKTSILTFIMILSLPKESRYTGWTTRGERPNLTTSNWESTNAKTPAVLRMLETNTFLKPQHSIVRSTHLKSQEQIRTQFYRYNWVSALLQLRPARDTSSRPVAKTLREVFQPRPKTGCTWGKGSDARAAVIYSPTVLPICHGISPEGSRF
jgi:hypothetical protein